jgi:hypothetical protein
LEALALALAASALAALAGLALGMGLALGVGGSPDAAASLAPAFAPSSVLPAQDLYEVPYNGDFTFTRIRYGTSGFSLRGGGFGSNAAWNHDYPAADRNLQVILADFTFATPNTKGSNVLDLEDDRIFQSPILYMSEPGFWSVTSEGAENLREHLLKGGFLIFDDFEDDQWDNMAAQMRVVLPDHDWVEIDESHPIFRTFFAVEDIYVPHPLVRVTPNYQVIFQDNDPTKRIMVLANHNSDLAEYWEFPRGFGLDPTNDAFRLGVNYIMYALAH